MLVCLPQSICSWDFRVSGTSSGPASLTFNFFTEQSTISLGGSEFTVSKHDPMSGHWTLEQDGRVEAGARKPSAMFRSFEVSAGDQLLTVKARSAFARSFEIISGDRTVGSICPAHAFTRRATIDCTPEVSEIAQLFSFWLAVLTWRRAAKSSNA